MSVSASLVNIYFIFSHLLALFVQYFLSHRLFLLVYVVTWVTRFSTNHCTEVQWNIELHHSVCSSWILVGRVPYLVGGWGVMRCSVDNMYLARLVRVAKWQLFYMEHTENNIYSHSRYSNFQLLTNFIQRYVCEIQDILQLWDGRIFRRWVSESGFTTSTTVHCALCTTVHYSTKKTRVGLSLLQDMGGHWSAFLQHHHHPILGR